MNKTPEEKRSELKERFLREEISAEEYTMLKNDLEEEIENLEKNKEKIEPKEENNLEKEVEEEIDKEDVEENIPKHKTIYENKNKKSNWKYFVFALIVFLIIVAGIKLVSNNSIPNNNINNNQKVDVSIDTDPSIGPNDAKVTIVEFSDYQCPFCSRAEETMKQILKAYEGKIKFVYRDFPLNIHPFAQKAAEASECANEQGKFWEYHDILFEKQAEWSPIGVDKLKEYAKNLGLDSNKFNQCLDSDKYLSEVKKDLSDGQSYGVEGTPTTFVNGIKLVGAQPISEFKKVIDQELNK